jgi:septation ring formation regulator EzrA
MSKRCRDSTFVYDQHINYKIPKYNDNEIFSLSENAKIKHLFESILLKLDKLDKDIQDIDYKFKEINSNFSNLNSNFNDINSNFSDINSNFRKIANYINSIQTTNYNNSPCSYIS